MNTPYFQVAQGAADDPRLAELDLAYRWAWLELCNQVSITGPLAPGSARKLRVGAELPVDCWEELVRTGAAVVVDQGLIPALDLCNAGQRTGLSRARAEAGRQGGIRSGEARRSKTKQTGSKSEYESTKQPEAKRSIEIEVEREDSPSLRSGESDGELVPTARPREDLAAVAARERLVKERAQDVATHWAHLTGRPAPVKKARAIAEFDVPWEALVELLDRSFAADTYDLGSPVLRAALQRLESECRVRDQARSGGVVDISEMLASRRVGGQATR